MKLPSRLLGLLIATAAAPIVAGCTADTSDPQPSKTGQAQTSQAPETTTEQVNTPKSATPAPEPKEEETEETEQSAPPPPSTPSDDPCPGCGMG